MLISPTLFIAYDQNFKSTPSTPPNTSFRACFLVFIYAWATQLFQRLRKLGNRTFFKTNENAGCKLSKIFLIQPGLKHMA